MPVLEDPALTLLAWLLVAVWAVSILVGGYAVYDLHRRVDRLAQTVLINSQRLTELERRLNRREGPPWPLVPTPP